MKIDRQDLVPEGVKKSSCGENGLYPARESREKEHFCIL
jgi:hypothetical protein